MYMIGGGGGGGEEWGLALVPLNAASCRILQRKIKKQALFFLPFSSSFSRYVLTLYLYMHAIIYPYCLEYLGLNSCVYFIARQGDRF